jgi:monoamine oxidase
MLQPVGGMDRIAEAFEAEILELIRYNAEVTEIRATANGVRVMYKQLGSDLELDADYCVITIPASVLATIANDFSAAYQDEIASFQYSSAVRVAFQSRRFWEQEHNIYGGISWTQQAITQVWYPNHGFGEQQGIVLGAYIFGGAAGDAFSVDSPAARAAKAQQEASNLHPQFATEAARGISTAWKNVPYQLGAWGMSTPDVLLSPDRNFFFAGEHLSILQGWQEGAILSAYQAIDAVVARDLA